MTIKIQHKRSAVASKAPLPADLEYGEIAVNYEATDPALYVKDSADAIRKIGEQPAATEADQQGAGRGPAPLAPLLQNHPQQHQGKGENSGAEGGEPVVWGIVLQSGGGGRSVRGAAEDLEAPVGVSDFGAEPAGEGDDGDDLSGVSAGGGDRGESAVCVLSDSAADAAFEVDGEGTADGGEAADEGGRFSVWVLVGDCAGDRAGDLGISEAAGDTEVACEVG